MSEPEKQRKNRKEWLAPFMYKKGQSGNPAGRPAGKTLKEYTRQMIAAMTEEERQAFLQGLPKDVIWKMAEGNPTDKLEGEISISVEVVEYGKNTDPA